MLRYVQFEVEKSSINSVIALHNKYSGTDSGKLSIIRNGEMFFRSLDDQVLISGVIEETSKILKSKGFEGSDRAYIDFHEYQGDNIPHLCACSCDREIDVDICTVCYFISNDFRGGEMDICRDDDESNIFRTLDTHSSKDEMAKVIVLNEKTYHFERPSSGKKKCLIVYMKYY